MLLECVRQAFAILEVNLAKKQAQETFLSTSYISVVPTFCSNVQAVFFTPFHLFISSVILPAISFLCTLTSKLYSLTCFDKDSWARWNQDSQKAK